MRTLTSFPVGTAGKQHGAATGACLITRKSDPAKIGRIIDISRDLDDMPSFGRICISEQGVELLAEQLNMRLVPKADLAAAASEAEIELVKVTAERDELRASLAEFKAAALVFASAAGPSVP